MGNSEIKLFHEAPQGIHVAYPYTDIIFDEKTGFQHALCLRTVAFGRTLFLDSILNSAEFDEFIYHEGIVHPAMMRSKNIDRVLIIGGGEGGILREVLKYIGSNGVKKATMVDIDGKLVELCRNYLSDIYGNPFADSRAELLIEDGRKYVQQTEETFDVIILDLNEASEDSPARMLFTIEFYQELSKKLNSGGIVSIQGEWITSKFHRDVMATLSQVFAHVMPLELHIPSFLLPQAIILAANDSFSGPEQSRLHSLQDSLQFYSEAVDQKISTLPVCIQKAYSKPATIYSESELPDFSSETASPEQTVR